MQFKDQTRAFSESKRQSKHMFSVIIVMTLIVGDINYDNRAFYSEESWHLFFKKIFLFVASIAAMEHIFREFLVTFNIIYGTYAPNLFTVCLKIYLYYF